MLPAGCQPWALASHRMEVATRHLCPRGDPSSKRHTASSASVLPGGIPARAIPPASDGVWCPRRCQVALQSFPWKPSAATCAVWQGPNPPPQREGAGLARASPGTAPLSERVPRAQPAAKGSGGSASALCRSSGKKPRLLYSGKNSH